MLTINIDQMLAETQAHIAADAVRQGSYWDGEHGCFIGCLSHSSRAEPLTERFGLPLPLVRICEGIFEGLPAAEARDFFAAIPVSIGRDGRDLSRVHWAFLASTLRRLPRTTHDVNVAVDVVIEGLDRLARGDVWSAARAAAAEEAAAAEASWAAARAAWAAAAAEEAARAERCHQRDDLLTLLRA